MEEWDPLSEKVNKLRPDAEKARSLVKLVALRESKLPLFKLPADATLLAEAYYEIVKELTTALLSVDGWKTLSHELLIGYLAKFYQEFTAVEIALLDQLRQIRNDIAYRGVMIPAEYLERNQRAILAAIAKLKKILQTKLR